MDFFNVNYWSLKGGVYTEWRGFYSPINIYFAKLISSNDCKEIGAWELRNCNLNSYLIYIASSILIIGFLFYKLSKNILLSFYLLISMPMLYAIERGNYIFIPVIILSLALILKNNNALNSIFVSLIISLKLYMGIVLIPILLINGQKRLLLIIGLYLILCLGFGLMINDNNWIFIPQNTLDFNSKRDSMEIMWATTSLSGIITYHKEYINNAAISIILIYIFVLLKFFISIRLYLYMKEVSVYKPDIAYIILLFVLALFIITDAPGYYGLIMLYPLYIYCDSKNLIKKSDGFIFLIALLPYFLTIKEIDMNLPISTFSQERVIIKKSLTVEFIIVPILLIIFFFRLTRNNIWSDNESKQ